MQSSVPACCPAARPLPLLCGCRRHPGRWPRTALPFLPRSALAIGGRGKGEHPRLSGRDHPVRRRPRLATASTLEPGFVPLPAPARPAELLNHRDKLNVPGDTPMSTSASVFVWKVGCAVAEELALTPQDVAAHLLNDWLPGVPAGQGADFMGWPSRLLLSDYGQLFLSDVVARTERQWKGMISWMLGVAGARAYLKEDKYRWIAPISAFFDDAVQPVSVPQWYLPFPQPDLTVVRTRNRVLCPDYIAVRSAAGQRPIEWAVAEAKGTKKFLTARTDCQPDWREQVRNIQISLDQSRLIPQRYIVIATHVSPGGPLRIKAWNNEIAQDTDAFPPALPEVVCAHLFGFYSGIGLLAVARTVASAVFRRAMHKRRMNLRWASEVDERGDGGTTDKALPQEVRVGRGEMSAVVEISEPLRSLTAALVTIDHQDEATKAIRRADQEPDEWWDVHRDRHEPETVTLPFGIRVRFSGSGS